MKRTATRLEVLCTDLDMLQDCIAEYQELRAEAVQELSMIEFLGWTPKNIGHLLNVTMEKEGRRTQTGGPKEWIH